jgi:hypothetical protein
MSIGVVKMIDQDWPEFVETMDFVGMRVVVADEDGLVAYSSVRPSIKNAYRELEKARGWLDNTMDYESERLDEAYEKISEAMLILGEFK